jgi:hypothetical protein
MNFFLVSLAILAFTFAPTESVSSLRQVTPCSAAGSALSLQSLQVTPMPIVHPGVANLQVSIDLLRGLVGKIKTSVNLRRIVNGLSLDVRCFLANEYYYGSCTYDDLCEMVDAYRKALNLDDITCPFDFQPGLLSLDVDLDLPSISQTDISFLSNGEYDMRIDSADTFGPLGCLDLKFYTKPATH